jgi:uncharacterized protein (DUF4213/DUF364 family)
MSQYKNILEDILESIKNLYVQSAVKPGIFVRAGIKSGWSTVIGTEDQCGLAMNFTGWETAFGRPKMDVARVQSFIGKSLFDLASDYIHSSSWQERALGIAAMSALSQPFLRPFALEAMGYITEEKQAFGSYLKSDDITVVIGYGGGISKLLGKCKELHVTDMRPRESFQTLLIDKEVRFCPDGVHVHPAEENEAILKKATAVYITGSTLVNGTFEELMGYVNGARYIGMYGASASLVPEALFAKGVNVIHSMQITDARKFEEGLFTEMNMERIIQHTQQGLTIMRKT